MKIGLLTSSRADYGIYYPLISKLKDDTFFDLEIIAFGTHLSEKFGFTIKEVENQYQVQYKIETLPSSDTAKSISESIGVTIKKFSSFWDKNKFDLVLCLGDRFEIFAAVTAGTPFNVKFAHIHAGETTLGAIDNAYRHSITLMSAYAFVTNDEYKKRAQEILNKPDDVFNVGALSIDNLSNQELYTVDEINKHFGIDLSKPTILCTFHPETVNFEMNELYVEELIHALEKLSENYQVLITKPNADTTGLMIRNKLEEFSKNRNSIFLYESLGMKGYLSCMKFCSFMLGNTSSGFVEAAYFPKWVINLGGRQNGRIRTANIIDCAIKKDLILDAVNKMVGKEVRADCNIYGKGSAANNIVNKLKQLYNV